MANNINPCRRAIAKEVMDVVTPRGTLDRYEVAAILNDIGNFDMSNFKGRLTLQKTVYLLQSFGLNLGYVFKWYLHGTYCPTLASDGRAIEELAPNMPAIPIEFESEQAQRRYLEFKEFLADKKYDPAMLEISSSVCYLDGLGLEKGEILELVKDKKPKFSMEQCKAAWGDLEKYGVVGHRNG